MVFNWFHRKSDASAGSADKKDSDTSQVESEQKATQQQPIDQADSKSVEEPSSAAAEDYLSWAKAAYKNVQKQQVDQSPEIDTTDSKPVDDSTAQPAATATAAKPQESQETESPAAETSEGSEETDTTVAAEIAQITAEAESQSESQAESELEESTVSEASVDTAETVEPVTEQSSDQMVEEVVSTPSDSVSSNHDSSIAMTSVENKPIPESDSLTSDIAPSTETTEEETPASGPSWARRASTNRLARLERLKETAIETPEPEPEVATVIEDEGEAEIEQNVLGLAFDDGFLWSAEVLASQGRSPEDISIEEISWLKQLRQGLGKTRRGLINQLKAIVGQGPLNQDAVMEIEALLLQADVGVEATDYIIETLQARLREESLPAEKAIAYLKQIIRDLLEQPYSNNYSRIFAPENDTLNIWLMTGVNGAGKTTTIGKLANLGQKSGYRCLIAAADTFRAAAVEQVKVWGERSGTEVIANPGKNTDPAAVVFDGISAAQSRNTELLLVDTAGRLQNKKNLMEELAKIRRIVAKKAPDAKVESLLVLDATLGQNGLRQAQVFSEAAKLSGVVLTKLDGSAKGGVALAVVRELGLPIRFIGAGEGIEDLRPFSSYEFVEALLSG
ncbi:MULTISPECIES: signal recognition particle-docking protein FtsY [unclassified Moorena]|uniref:signal recognition particle-docking protein FtsY n=1 Tax=unclassified Moorena TaxID=2683338 RepID=UPI0013FE6992|nr:MULTISPECIES: signal recognition particle-docking protein FtsY [unclassified Moorena]NEO12735.1 signal recognition particle-docking protein FtsY [Moorena sp. SIO3E8]NEP99510.1 signal recognition particle-docking protein FtsY [Moorena sp. SIO3F7]